jgi:hypothetical protein
MVPRSRDLSFEKVGVYENENPIAHKAVLLDILSFLLLS